MAYGHNAQIISEVSHFLTKVATIELLLRSVINHVDIPLLQSQDANPLGKEYRQRSLSAGIVLRTRKRFGGNEAGSANPIRASFLGD